MASKFTPPTKEELRTARNLLINERPRAAAVMAAAWVDDGLRALLRAYLGRESKLAEAVLAENGPLGTFSTRIKISFLLGLIGEPFRRDLDAIRRVRNDFAHVRTRVSFETEWIRRLVTSLLFGQMLEALWPDRYSTQHKFIATAYRAAEILIVAADKMNPPPVNPVEAQLMEIGDRAELSLFTEILDAMDQSHDLEHS